MTPITCRTNANMVVRFIDHAKLGLSSTIQPHEKNLLEKAGDLGMWAWENVPAKMANAVRDPQVVTVALTSLALYVDSLCFYPAETSHYTRVALALLPTIPVWLPRFLSWTTSCELFASLGVRAEGRFRNKELMADFYGKRSHQDDREVRLATS